MVKVVCLNEQFLPADSARITVLDQGFLYGYGLFETILVRRGKPVFLEEHLKRLAAGCKTLEMALPVSLAKLGQLVQETIKQNGTIDGALRLTFSAGPDPGGKDGNLVILTRPLPYTEEHYQHGFKAGITTWRRNEHSPIITLKTLNYLENLLAKREARKRGWDEALFLNTAGYVAEGAVSNVFLIKDGQVITPSCNQGLLPGIMRRAVLETCTRLGIPGHERPVTPDELTTADECFLTNSLMEVMPLVEINNRPIGSGSPGAVTGQIKQALPHLQDDML